MISFTADKIKVNGPKVDGGYSVTFDVGQDMQQQVALLLVIPQQVPTIVEVKPEERV